MENNSEQYTTLMLAAGTGGLIMLTVILLIFIFWELLLSKSWLNETTSESSYNSTLSTINAPSNTGIKKDSISDSTPQIFYIPSQESPALHQVSVEMHVIHAEETATSPPVITHI